MFNPTQDRTMPGTRRLLRITVLLPIASIFLLGLTTHWRAGGHAGGPDPLAGGDGDHSGAAGLSAVDRTPPG
ncbi:MAG: hypothetical protein V9H69_00660 [Anaerolineae bacterium]